MPVTSKHLLLSALLVALWVANSFAADSEGLKQQLELLQKALPNSQPVKSEDDFEKELRALQELEKQEGITNAGQKSLEDRLKNLKEQLPQKK